MDDNAQTSSVTPPPTPVSPPVSVQSDVKQTPLVTPPQPVQPATRPVEPPSVSRGEHGPIPTSMPQREAAPIDEADAVPPATTDDSSDVIDDPDAVPVEAQAASEEAIEVKEFHPQVEVSSELQEAGVDAGPDAKREQLPEEKQTLEVEEPEEPAQADPKQILAQSLPMDYVQAVQTKKTSKIRDSAKWFADLVKRQWEIIQGKP